MHINMLSLDEAKQGSLGLQLSGQRGDLHPADKAWNILKFN